MIRKNIPNFITSLNILAGTIGILFALGNSSTFLWASYLLFLAGIFDFLDGLTARWLNAYSELGKQLDSLADAISFGILPGFIMFRLLENNFTGYFKYLSFMLPLFALWRLAKFNIDDRQSEHFIGLPTPSNGLFIAGLSFIPTLFPYQQGYLFQNPWLMGFIITSLCVLMVSEISLFSLKFKSFNFSTINTFRYILLLSSLVLLIFFNFAALPIIILIYVILSIIANYTFLKQ